MDYVGVVMKRNAYILFLLFSFLFTSCGAKPDESYMLETTADEVIRCFDEEDIDALKLLFCKIL